MQIADVAYTGYSIAIFPRVSEAAEADDMCVEDGVGNPTYLLFTVLFRTERGMSFA